LSKRRKDAYVTFQMPKKTRKTALNLKKRYIIVGRVPSGGAAVGRTEMGDGEARKNHKKAPEKEGVVPGGINPLKALG